MANDNFDWDDGYGKAKRLRDLKKQIEKEVASKGD
jgi:hypothetical protein